MLHHRAKHVALESDRKIYCELKENYNRITQSKKRKYQEKIASEIENLNSSDPQDYWRFRGKNTNLTRGILKASTYDRL